MFFLPTSFRRSDFWDHLGVRALVLIGRSYSRQPKKDSVILLPLRPASLTHENTQRRKIIHDMRPVGRKERSMNLKIFLWNILFQDTYYSETPPYGHLGNTVTSLLRPLSLAAWQKPPYIFLYKKPLLIRPIFFGPLVNVLTAFLCNFSLF